MILRTVFLTVLCFSCIRGNAQDLLDALGPEPEQTTRITNAFKSSRVISSHSMEMLPAGALDFRILHRFGRVDQGFDEFWGLDNATMRMSFDYGITKNLTVGIARSTFKKELDAFIKYRILWQSEGAKNIPVSVVWTSGLIRNGLKNNVLPDPEIEVTEARRLSYFHQIIVGRKFNERLTAQINPILLHSNIVDNILIPNNMYALGLGARYKLNNRFAVVVDYYYPFNKFPRDFRSHPLSIGVDIETGGHVFQLHFSNSTGMNERALLAEENGNLFSGEVQFGFNLSRIFQIVKNKIDEE
ncbi:MAG: hypothetical protein IPM34_05990 [Saprospiraceae bacterium]|nr:hypothetical protein [Saprospiraceae bacterium]